MIQYYLIDEGCLLMTLDELLTEAPNVLKDLSAEFYRVGGRHMDVDPKSQQSACFLVAFRSVSLLSGMRCLLTPATGDSWDVLLRAYMEAKDLLFTFRFNDQGIRNSIKEWFEGKNGNSWRPRHKKCQELAENLAPETPSLENGGARFRHCPIQPYMLVRTQRTSPLPK